MNFNDSYTKIYVHFTFHVQIRTHSCVPEDKISISESDAEKHHRETDFDETCKADVVAHPIRDARNDDIRRCTNERSIAAEAGAKA